MYNRLTGGPSSASLAYDPDGRLYQTIGAGVTTRFLYDGASMIGEFNASNVLQRRYVPGAGLDESAAWYEGAGVSDRRWPVADERGSVIAVTNASGAASGAGFGLNTYDEYGLRGAGNVGRFQFAGAAWLPEVGLHHMRARAYAAATGRFVQSDPILHGGGMNLYAYVGNDPVNFTDPWGLQACDADDQIVVCPPPEFPGGRTPSGAGLAAAGGGTPGVGGFGFEPDETVEVEGDGIVVTAWTRRPQTSTSSWLDDPRAKGYAEGGTFDIPVFGWGRSAGGWLFREACGCFVEGTEVMTPEGLVAIETIEIGDEVLAWNPETGETTTETVTALIRPEPKIIWRLEMRDGDGETEVFEVTDDHPWYVEGAGWVETQALRPGQRIETADDRGLTILDIARTDRVERTYNLTIDGPHTFLVGEDGAVVHNSCWDLIARGHAFAKHVLQRGEFRGLGIRTVGQFADHIRMVMQNATYTRRLSGGRTAFWHDGTGTVVIRNPRAVDGGTAFQPTTGQTYFWSLQ